MDHILLAKHDRIHGKSVCQFIDCGLHRKNTLCGTVTAVSACGHPVCIDYLILKTECLRVVHRDGFVAA